MEKDVLEITLDLIKIPSTGNRPEEINRVFEYVKDFFSNKNLFIKSYVQNQKLSLVISTVDTLSPDILMIGHLDVVDGDVQMFEPRIENGKLIGRGACDMKSENAVMMYLMAEFSEQENPPSVGLMLTSDEEIGGADGVGYLVNSVGYRCKVALVPDGSSSPEEMAIANKGVLHLRLKTKGKPAHGSSPWLGDNAIDKLMNSYQKVKNLFPETKVSDHWFNTCNIGNFQAGNNINQVPDSASCGLDIRFVESDNAQKITEKIRTEIPDCEVEIVVTGLPCSTPADNNYLRLYSQVVQEKFNLKSSFSKNCGGHDGRYLSALGIPVIVTRPISGDQHSEKEWVDIASLKMFADVYREFINQVSNI